MIIGIIQPIVGVIGGNDKVLDSLVKVLSKHEIRLYTFSKSNKEFPSNVIVIHKLPINLPILGIYQKFLMPKFDYSKCDVLISLTGMNVKTDKPLIIYDQNKLSDDLSGNIPIKYQKGFWKFYYLPYRILNKFTKPNINAFYVCNSYYSKTELSKYIDPYLIIKVIYPCINLGEFFTQKKKNQICVVGRITPEKNLKYVISVLNQTNCPCIIYGNVTKTNISYYNELLNLCDDNVTIQISKSREELLELLSESRIIFSGAKETFGLTTIEGIASGCIPIVPDHSGHKETVPREVLRYSNDQRALKLIDRILNDKMIAERHILESLQENLCMKFTEATFKEQILKTLNKVVRVKL